MARTNNEVEGEFENRIEGTQDEEPGNQDATTSKPLPSRTISKKPSTPFAVSKPGGRPMPKGKFVNKHSASKVVKSKSKNRTGKKYKGGPKQPPTVRQKMKSFGGV